MYSKIDSVHNIIGFGETADEALVELQFNKARRNIAYDDTEVFKKLRQKIFSWLPTPNVLSIAGCTALIYREGWIRDLRNGNCVEANKGKLSHYSTMFRLLGWYLSFIEFTLAVGEEVDDFLSNISNDFGKLDDFPYIKPGDIKELVTVTNYPNGYFYCTTRDKNELLISDSKKVLSVEIPFGIDKENMLAYGFAKLGGIYDGRSVQNVKEAK
ncbi:MAG: hypothetical protein LBS29_04630 [Endomicrobium sp.]|nr:hypothetical protein [Endomicrobium sp.]